MSEQDTIPSVRSELRLADQDLAREAEAWLAEHDASNIRLREQLGVVPLLPLALLATVAIPTLAALFMWIRSKTGCQVIVDARGEKIVTDVDCRSRDGRVIVVTKDDTRVQLTDVPELFDMNKVITAALTGGADLVRDAAKLAGATVVK